MKNGLPITMDDKEYLPLSWLSQVCYCQRRAGLLLNERLWSESIDTAKGRAEHEKVHTQRVERRGDFIKLYEYTVYSDSLALNGKCDCIEESATKTDVIFRLQTFLCGYIRSSTNTEICVKKSILRLFLLNLSTLCSIIAPGKHKICAILLSPPVRGRELKYCGTPSPENIRFAPVRGVN